MRSKIKKLLGVVLSTTLLFSTLSVSAIDVDVPSTLSVNEITLSNTYGTAYLDESTNTLRITSILKTISKYADRANYPWYAYRDSIEHVIFDNSFDSIPQYTICAFTSLKDIKFNYTCKSIEGYAFNNSTLEGELNLTNVKAIQTDAFYGTGKTGVTSIIFDSNLQSIGNSVFNGFSKCKSLDFNNASVSLGVSTFYSSNFISTDIKNADNLVYPSTYNNFTDYWSYSKRYCKTKVQLNFVTSSLNDLTLRFAYNANHTIYTDSDTGNNYIICNHDILSSINDPSKYNFQFYSAGVPLAANAIEVTGFYSDEACTTLLSSDVVTDNQIIYLKIESTNTTEIRVYHDYSTIHLMEGNTRDLVDTLVIDKNSTIDVSTYSSLKAPSLRPSIIEGIYTDSDCTVPYTSQVAGDITTLYVKSVADTSSEYAWMYESGSKPFGVSSFTNNDVSNNPYSDIIGVYNKSLKKLYISRYYTSNNNYSLDTVFSTLLDDFNTIDWIIYFSDDINAIREDLFNSMKIADITIPSRITTIGDNAFSLSTINNISFESDSSLTTIGDYAFLSSSIENINLPDTVESIGKNCFQDSSLGTIKIPSNLTSLGNGAFYRCQNLTSVDFNNSNLASISDNAFARCYNLEGDLVIPSSVRYIGTSAFFDCFKLGSKLTLPNKGISIRNQAFANCYNLTTIDFNNSTISLTANEFSAKIDDSINPVNTTIVVTEILNDSNITYKQSSTSCTRLTYWTNQLRSYNTSSETNEVIVSIPAEITLESTDNKTFRGSDSVSAYGTLDSALKVYVTSPTSLAFNKDNKSVNASIAYTSHSADEEFTGICFDVDDLAKGISNHETADKYPFTIEVDMTDMPEGSYSSVLTFDIEIR